MNRDQNEMQESFKYKLVLAPNGLSILAANAWKDAQKNYEGLELDELRQEPGEPDHEYINRVRDLFPLPITSDGGPELEVEEEELDARGDWDSWTDAFNEIILPALTKESWFESVISTDIAILKNGKIIVLFETDIEIYKFIEENMTFENAPRYLASKNEALQVVSRSLLGDC